MVAEYFTGITWLNRATQAETQQIVREFAGRYGINYAHEGGIAISYDQRPSQFVVGPVAWITRPGHFSYGSLPGAVWTNRFINFTGPRVERLIAGGLLDVAEPIIPVVQPERVCSAFDALYHRLQTDYPGQARSVHDLEGLLLLLSEQRRLPEVLPARAVVINELCRRVREQPQVGLEVAHEAHRLGLSAVTFRRQFSVITGVPPHQYLLRARMERAATLLATTNLAIGAIAHAVGIDDPYRFSKGFRQKFHVTPRSWRAMTR